MILIKCLLAVMLGFTAGFLMAAVLGTTDGEDEK